MKLRINYDLMSAIAEANTGYSLNKTAKRVLFYTSISSTLGAIDNIAMQTPIEDYIIEVMCYIAAHTFLTGLTVATFSNIVKRLSLRNLQELSTTLKSLNVNTDKDLLLNAYKYKTEYNLNTETSKLPKLEQKKYIMVPVYENGEEKEVSLLQEHTIGSNEYVISIGSPKKAYKLSYSFAK